MMEQMPERIWVHCNGEWLGADTMEIRRRSTEEIVANLSLAMGEDLVPVHKQYTEYRLVTPAEVVVDGERLRGLAESIAEVAVIAFGDEAKTTEQIIAYLTGAEAGE